MLNNQTLRYLYYRLDTATEEGFRHAEHHDAKQSFITAGLFRVFANWVTELLWHISQISTNLAITLSYTVSATALLESIGQPSLELLAKLNQ